MWLFFTVTPLLGLSYEYNVFFAYVFVILCFVPLLALMDTEITMEKDGQKWTESGAKPNSKRESSYDKYKRELRGRTRR